MGMHKQMSSVNVNQSQLIDSVCKGFLLNNYLNDPTVNYFGQLWPIRLHTNTQ